MLALFISHEPCLLPKTSIPCVNLFVLIILDSLEHKIYNSPSAKVIGELAGNLQICLLCHGALQGIISSMYRLFSNNGFAQLPTPTETLDLGNPSFRPFKRGVTTSTSPKSLFLRTKKLFSLFFICLLVPMLIYRLNSRPGNQLL